MAFNGFDNDDDNTYQFDGEWELRAQTDRAVLIVEDGISPSDEQDGVNKFWVPKSVITGIDMEDVGDVGTIEVREWFAKKLDLI